MVLFGRSLWMDIAEYEKKGEIKPRMEIIHRIVKENVTGRENDKKSRQSE